MDDGNATFENKTIDSVTNHHSTCFESYAEKLLGKPIHTQSFAIGGQMPSDTCALFRAMTAKENARPILIWGVGPRDLVDSTFHDAASTETVRYLDRVCFPNDVLPESKSAWKTIERQLEKGLYLYGNRSTLQCFQRQATEGLLNKTVGTTFNTIQAPNALLKIASAGQPEENSKGQWMAAPYKQKATRKPYWKDNSKEYSLRYRPFRVKTFENQSKYMQTFLQEAHTLGFPVLLVNMPLLKENIDLLPAGVYNQYIERLRILAKQNGAKFLDFNMPGMFCRSDFCDPVHLHGLGAQKFLRILADEAKPLMENSSLAGKNSQI